MASNSGWIFSLTRWCAAVIRASRSVTGISAKRARNVTVRIPALRPLLRAPTLLIFQTVMSDVRILRIHCGSADALIVRGSADTRSVHHRRAGRGGPRCGHAQAARKIGPVLSRCHVLDHDICALNRQDQRGLVKSPFQWSPWRVLSRLGAQREGAVKLPPTGSDGRRLLGVV